MTGVRRLCAVGSVLAVGLVLVPLSADASTPPAGTVTVPTSPGGTATDTWTGTSPPGANPTSDCAGFPLADHHEVTVTVPAGAYDTVEANFAFNISWTPMTGTEDLILTVVGPDGKEVGSSDGGSPSENVMAKNLAAGKYDVITCSFVSPVGQPYNGKLTVTTVAANSEVSLPAAPAQGLAFGAAVPADLQRDEAEPLIEVAKDGHIYTCGPTGFSNASDYAQVSTDGGDQFHLLGTPPRGQQGAGGGGDCGLGTGVTRNSAGNFNYSYTGLGPLTGFVTSTSPDNGHSIATGGPFGNGVTDKGGGADRQWQTFLDDKTVMLIYNQQAPRNIVVQTSTNAGLTYGPDTRIGANSPDFPGPIRYDEKNNVVFFAWSKGNSINLSVSKDRGNTWKDCVAATAPKGSTPTLFSTADSDRDGNIYVAYGENKNFHTYVTSLSAGSVPKCNKPVDQNPLTSADPKNQPTTNPGFSTPIQVDRGNVRTTVFPWVAAGGAPGRIAVSFYGTETDGDPGPGDFKASWDVYVNQSLNALASDGTFSQVKATTHPFHYDSICLEGLGCDLSAPMGDRSLADFFAIDYDPVTGALSTVFNRGNKKPGETAGHIATPMVTTQIAGPSNGGNSLTASSAKAVVRTSSADQSNDALSSYSLLAPAVPVTPPTKNEKASDFVSVKVAPQVNLSTGKPVANGGFTVTMKLGDLSDAALQQAMSDTGSLSLLWVFHFVNGYQASAASARWNALQGFTFGYNNYTPGQAPCLPGDQSGEKCLQFPGGTSIQGKVDRKAGTIALSVPRSVLRALTGSTGAGQRPTQAAAKVGTRFYDAAAFSVANNVSPVQDVQSFLYPLDNTPAMDFLLPAAARGGNNGGGGSGGGGGGGGGSGGSGGSGSGGSGGANNGGSANNGNGTGDGGDTGALGSSLPHTGAAVSGLTLLGLLLLLFGVALRRIRAAGEPGDSGN